MSIGVSYDSDLDKVTQILQDAIKSNTHVSNKKDAMVGISNFGDSSVDFEVRVWVNSDKLNNSRFAINKAIWDALKDNQINIPFPQREVRMLNE